MKIVFFINLDKTEKNKGIYKLFSTIQNNDFVKKYFYSTDACRVTTNHFTEKFLGITKNEVKLSNKAKDIKNSDIILIDDNTSLDDCRDLFNPDTLVLYHSKPEWADDYFKVNKNNIKKAKKDFHERYAKGYMKLMELAEAFESESNSFNNSEYENIIKQIVKFFEVDEELENKIKMLQNKKYY